MDERRTWVLENYNTPVSGYPTKKLGTAEITKIRRGTKSVYYAEGVRGYLVFRYKTPTKITCLKIDGKVWMTDEPQFVYSLESFAERSKGSVLVAGLGLGIIVHQLVRNPDVKQIDVVEREKSVIDLVGPMLPKDERIAIHNDDFYTFVHYDSQRTKRDVIIWDLAVGDAGNLREGREIVFVRAMMMANYGPDPKVFIHGIDRDPVGAEFAKTKEFQSFHSLMHL